MLKPRAQRRAPAVETPVPRGTDDSKYGSKSGLFGSPVALLLLAGALLFVVAALFQFAKMEHLVDGRGPAFRGGIDPLLPPPGELAQGEEPVQDAPLSTEQETEEMGRLKAQEKLVEWLDDDSGVPVGYVRVPRIPAGQRTSGKLLIENRVM